MRQLSLVERDNHDQDPCTDSGDKSAGVEVVDVLRGGLDGAANKEDEGACGESGPAAEVVAYRPREGGADDAPDGEEGDDETGVGWIGGVEFVDEGRRRDNAGNDAEVLGLCGQRRCSTIRTILVFDGSDIDRDGLADLHIRAKTLPARRRHPPAPGR